MEQPQQILVNGEAFSVAVVERKRNSVLFQLNGRNYLVQFEAAVPDAKPAEARRQGAKPAAGSSKTAAPAGAKVGQVCAPIPGLVVELLVGVGSKVQEGEVLARLEAMKMQNNIFAPVSGVVETVQVAVGQEVTDGELLVVINPA